MCGQGSFAGEKVNFVEGPRGKFLQGFAAEGEPEAKRGQPFPKNHCRAGALREGKKIFPVQISFA